MNFLHSPGGKVALAVLAAVVPIFLGYSVGGSREHGKGLAAARVAEARCDSVTTAKNSEIARLGSFSDSLLIVISERREGSGRLRPRRTAVAGCGCEREHEPHGRSFFARWAPPLLGLAVGGWIGSAIGGRGGDITATAIATSTSGGGGSGGHSGGHKKPHKPKKCK